MPESDLLKFIDHSGTMHAPVPAGLLTPEQRDRIVHLWAILAAHAQRPDNMSNAQSMQTASDALDEIFQTLLPALTHQEIAQIDATQKVSLIVQWREAQPSATPFTPPTA